MRYLRARAYLREVLDQHLVEAVAYEEVARHAGTAAAHVYGGIIAVLQSECEERGLPYRGIPVGTVKRRATGMGNANKAAMLEAAAARWPEAELATDDEADALWIGLVLVEELGAAA